MKPQQTKIAELTKLRADLVAGLDAGAAHGKDLLTLANVVVNEAGSTSQASKLGVAYAYLNLTGGAVREPRGAEVSEYLTLNDRWAKLSGASERETFLKQFVGSLQAARERLDAPTPATTDPTGGATHWVSAIGLPQFSGQAGRYSRTEGRAANRAFPNWAIDPGNATAIANARTKGWITPTYGERSIPGVPREEFLFYTGVR